MIQKVLRCTLGIFSGNIYFDIANKPDRQVWLVCCSTEWGVEEKCSCVSSSSPMVSHTGGGTAGVQLVGDLGCEPFYLTRPFLCCHSACISSTSGR